VALTATNQTTPEGANVGETMHLVLMPWQSIKNHLNNFSVWLNDMRSRQGVKQQDYINPDLLKYIQMI